MSDYAKVLQRLRSESPDGGNRGPRPIEPTKALPVAPTDLVFEPQEQPNALRRSRLIEPARRPSSVAIANLLDAMRSLDNGRRCPTLVLAPVASDHDLRGLTSGLVRQADHRGLDLVVAELLAVSGRPSVRECLHSSALRDGRPPLAEVGPYEPVEIAEWHQAQCTERDVIILEGPSLEDSVDAALVARDFDGLLLVAESEKTSRVALKNAAERARESGCDVLGIVLESSRRWLPKWFDRLLDEFVG